jgi:hypothetical protein
MVDGAAGSVKLKNKLCLDIIFYSAFLLHDLPINHGHNFFILLFNIFTLRAAAILDYNSLLITYVYERLTQVPVTAWSKA